MKIITLLLTSLCITFSVAIADSVIDKKQADLAPSEVINDSATLKLLILDITNNVFGIGWSDRDALGVGRKKVIGSTEKITLKYGLDMMKLGYTIDAVTVSQGRREQQSNGEYSNLIIVEIPNAWSEIVHLENYEKLPVTKFKKGSIVLLLDSMAVQFQDGMECMVDDKTYIFKNDKWLER